MPSRPSCCPPYLACPSTRQEDLPQLEQLGSSLLALWRRHRRGGRMCTPLLLTADLLLSRTALRDLQPPESSFPEQVGRGVVDRKVVGVQTCSAVALTAQRGISLMLAAYGPC